MFGHDDINFDDMFLELGMATNTRRHKYKLFKSAIQVAFVHLSTLKEL